MRLMFFEEGAGFAYDTNRITLVTTQTETPLPLMSKRECAARIFDAIEEVIGNRHTEIINGGWQ